MYLIIGLGNPGIKYKKTRHNVGFMVLDLLLDKDEKWQTTKRANAQYLKKEIADQPIELIKPQAYMNNSGLAVAYAVKKHDLNPEDVIVVHDDIDLPLGKIRISVGSSSAGNKGVQSIIDHLSSKDFTRLRIGVAPEERPAKFNAAKYVLKPFSRKEYKTLEDILAQSIKAIESMIEKEPAKAMNEFNT